MTQKSPEAFRTISEVAKDLDLPQHVLRFWETRFSQIKPLKRRGGRRYYRPDDVNLLRGIQFLLYEKGYTIKGAQRVLRDRGIAHVCQCWRFDDSAQQEAPPPASPAPSAPVTASEVSHPGASDPLPHPPERLSKSDIQVLEEALVKLLHCKRLLVQGRVRAP